MIYSLGGLCSAANVTARQADYWVRGGYLQPVSVEGRPDTGTGHHRLFDESEVMVAAMLGRLSDLKSRAALVREVVERGAVDLDVAGIRLYLERPDEVA